MNYIFKNILAFMFILMVAAGCVKEDLVQFNQIPSVYFGTAIKFGSEVNTLNYSFAKKGNKSIDTITIPITLSGKALTKDATVEIVSVDSVLADTGFVKGVEGVDFKLLTPVVLPANGYTTQLNVIVYRNVILDTKKVSFFLRINPTADLGIGISSQTTYVVKMSYIQKPDTWDMFGTSQGWAAYNMNMGTWTPTKYKLILEALYNPIADTTVTEFPTSRFNQTDQYVQYLTQVRNYILLKYPGNYSSPLGIGPSITDPDAGNKYIQVGPANY